MLRALQVTLTVSSMLSAIPTAEALGEANAARTWMRKGALSRKSKLHK
jgi:hypothetical protein